MTLASSLESSSQDEDAWGVVAAEGGEGAGSDAAASFDVLGYVPGGGPEGGAEARPAEPAGEEEAGGAAEGEGRVLDTGPCPGGPASAGARSLVVRHANVVMPAQTLRADLVLSGKQLRVDFRPAEEAAPAPAGGAPANRISWDALEGLDEASRTFAQAPRRRRKRCLSLELRDVSAVLLRRYRLRDTALEVFFRRGRRRSLFLDVARSSIEGSAAEAEEEEPHADENARATALRDALVQRLCRLAPPRALKQWPKRSGAFLLRHRLRATALWQQRRLSNFEYLLQLNLLAGRSFNDLCQYPVFPWVLSNYETAELDLRDPRNYRDLSKPMGAQCPRRLEHFLARYEAMRGDPELPPFMYGSHYSTAVGVVLHFLLRLQPFGRLHQEIQSGHFDVADRLFSSVAETWRSNTANLSEVKELTPEWYCCPAFLENRHAMDLGVTQDGCPVGDVALPPWANGSAEAFVRVHRAALEGPVASARLHEWVDLVFGCAQMGPRAVDRHNVFFYLTYYGAVDVSAIGDEEKRRATELQIAHFGQCPVQLYTAPHPPRGAPPPGAPRPLPLALCAPAFAEAMRRAYARAAFAPGAAGAPLVPLRTTVPGLALKGARRLLRPRLLLLSKENVLLLSAGGMLDLLTWHVACAPATGAAAAAAAAAPAEENVVIDLGGGLAGPAGDPAGAAEALEGAGELEGKTLCVERHAAPEHLARLPLFPGGDLLSLGADEHARPSPLEAAAPARTVAATADGAFIAFASGHGTLSIAQTDLSGGGAAAATAVAVFRSASLGVCGGACGICFVGVAEGGELEAEGHRVLVGTSDGRLAVYEVEAPNLKIQRPQVHKRPARVLRGAAGGVSCCAMVGGVAVVVGGRGGTLAAHSMDRRQTLWRRRLRPAHARPLDDYVQPRDLCVAPQLGLMAVHCVGSAAGEGAGGAEPREVHEVRLVTVNGEDAAVAPIRAPEKRRGVVSVACVGTSGSVLCVAYGNGDVAFHDMSNLEPLVYLPSPTRRGETAVPLAFTGAPARRPAEGGGAAGGRRGAAEDRRRLRGHDAGVRRAGELPRQRARQLRGGAGVELRARRAGRRAGPRGAARDRVGVEGRQHDHAGAALGGGLVHRARAARPHREPAGHHPRRQPQRDEPRGQRQGGGGDGARQHAAHRGGGRQGEPRVARPAPREPAAELKGKATCIHYLTRSCAARSGAPALRRSALPPPAAPGPPAAGPSLPVLLRHVPAERAADAAEVGHAQPRVQALRQVEAQLRGDLEDLGDARVEALRELLERLLHVVVVHVAAVQRVERLEQRVGLVGRHELAEPRGRLDRRRDAPAGQGLHHEVDREAVVVRDFLQRRVAEPALLPAHEHLVVEEERLVAPGDVAALHGRPRRRLPGEVVLVHVLEEVVVQVLRHVHDLRLEALRPLP